MTKTPVGNSGQVDKSDTEEFRRAAVRVLETGGLRTTEVGRRLGVSSNLLWRVAWQRSR